ncbi:MAG: serine hydrolase domain-containing protein [Armatimonadota bacterium]
MTAVVRRICWMGAAVLVSACLVAPGNQDEAMPETLESVRTKHDLPAMGAALITKDKVEVFVAGYRKRGGEERAQKSDRWHLGSNTKAMTATLAAVLIEKGVLRWETTIGEVFPDAREEYRNVTIEMLLSHRGGFPPPEGTAPKGMTLLGVHNLPGTPREGRAEYAKRALAQDPHVKPGTQTVYSNMGYILAGALIEKKVGASWEDLMRTHIFEPLGMKSAGFGPMIEPWPHTAGGQALPPSRLADNPPVLGPAGTVHASLEDYAKFLRVHLGFSDLVKPETLRRLHSPPGGESYALGWGVVERDWAGGKALTHAGSNTLNYAVAWLAPERGFAVVVVTNQGGDKAAQACDSVAAALIR